MRFRRSSSAVLVVAAAALLGSTLPASAGSGPANPSPARGLSTVAAGSTTRSAGAVPAKPVKAVVVASWSGCGSSGVIWDALNANWSSYGNVPVTIDYSNQALCGATFTLDALEASGADVVILDDPAGISNEFTSDQIDALKTYAEEGHDLIGTYLTFAWTGNSIDNSGLAPLFGLVKNNGWNGGENNIIATYKLKKKVKAAKPLFRGLAKSYVSTGYNSSQLPGDGVWSTNDLDGAKLVGLNADKSAAITVYTEGSYNAVFIANMPEYGGGAQDQQFFYNALIYPKKG